MGASQSSNTKNQLSVKNLRVKTLTTEAKQKLNQAALVKQNSDLNKSIGKLKSEQTLQTILYGKQINNLQKKQLYVQNKLSVKNKPTNNKNKNAK